MKPSQIYSKDISILINNILKELYPNNIGRIDEPLCKTREGFIDDDFPAEEGDRWSILNYMYSNNAMRSQMFDYFLADDTQQDKSIESFIRWITDNKEKLFGADVPWGASVGRRPCLASSCLDTVRISSLSSS